MSQSNQDINDIFKIFAEAVRTILKDVCENSVSVLVIEPEIDQVLKILIPVPKIKQDYPLVRLLQEFRERDEIKKYLDFMLNGEEFPKRVEEIIINYFGLPPENEPDYRSLMFLRFLETLVKAYKERFGCYFAEENFKEIFNEMVKYVYSEDREIALVIPLINFKLKWTEEIIIDNYKIRKLTEWGIKKVAENQLIMINLYFNKINIVDLYSLETTIKDLNTDNDKLLATIDEFIKVMRLFKKGSVARSNILMKYSKTPKMLSSMVIPLINIVSGYISSLGENNEYSLDISEVDGLRQLWDLYKRVKNNLSENLKIALERFNKSYEENYIENKILDLAIAFELLFGRRDYDILVPRFISNDYNERKRVAEVLRNLRRKRNKIVHEGRSKSKPEELKAIAIEAEEIFRKTYIKLLRAIDENKGKKFEKIREEIIDKILYDEH